LITPATFPEPKAANIHAIAVRVRDEFGGALPCDGTVMQEFTGVGPKCANLALGIACLRRGLPYRAPRRAGKKGDPAADNGQAEEQGRVIPVDIHVHRVTNRWGIVRTKTPEQTTVALEAVLPREYDVEINRLLVPFGKYICTGGAPHCPSCPLIDICPKIGVTKVRA
jgi:endonuclease-3